MAAEREKDIVREVRLVHILYRGASLMRNSAP